MSAKVYFSRTITPEKVLELYKMVDKKLPDFPVPVKGVSYMDGCKVLFEDGWLIARFSGTEPRIRIFCEMPTREEAERLTGVMAAFLHLPTP